MKRFQFNLEKVLKIRNIEEDMAQNRLLEARQKAREIEMKLEEMNFIQLGLYQFLRDEKGLSVEEAIQVRNYLHLHRKKINQVEAKLALQEEEVAQRQGELFDKRRERQVLEKLKDKEYKRFYKEFLHKEQKELDEIGQSIKGIQGV